MSPSRPPAPLPDDLPDAVRVLLTELRELRTASGHDLRSLERRTHASRSSWSRWLGGETFVPRSAVTALAELCGGDRHRLEALWDVADQAREAAASGTPDATPPAEPDAPDGETSPPGDEAAAQDAEPAAPSETPLRRRGPKAVLIGAVAGCVLVSGAAGVLLGTTLRTNAQETPHGPGRASASPVARRAAVHAIYRHEVVARAQSWHPHAPGRVPYDQAGSYQGYRADGSGYASMALGLPAPGPNSAALLASYCERVPLARLGRGDLVVNATGGPDAREVMIFERWTGPSRAGYWAYQQRRGYGTDHLQRDARLLRDGRHVGCHPRNLRDDPVG
ncbi:helix-turn-helix domain-containing protein [Actinomadura sp. LD22]|uniref:Helix-turn-helix domain-containing protein n=1 Tax=Actinomadura physcomitrii TaxID=2650748 RepID=A0A6I4M601_9ACTN|nr:helix-turn-helix transcriptional regulator [Actinomadura physcomitrii]MVZ99200.1 helix-turn-helix domain-containing protein [Actinomadura physcomitrii]